MNQVLNRPLLTEKAMKLTIPNYISNKSQYVFEVIPSANKIEIKKNIEEMFEVDVVSIRTTLIKGKVKRRMTKRGMMVGRTKTRKKAYVTLKAGQQIEIVAGVQN